MNQYILNEIEKFHNQNIPLTEYPKRVSNLRNKINYLTKLKILYIGKMYNNNEIDEAEYKQLYTIFEYERLKYQEKVN